MNILNNRLYDIIDTKQVISAVAKWQKHPIREEQLAVLEDVVGDAIALYDSTRGASMTTWICYCVPRIMPRFLKMNRALVSLDAPVNNDIGEEASLHNILESSHDTEKEAIASITAEVVKAAIEKLDPKSKKIANLLLQSYEEGKGDRCGQIIADTLMADGSYKTLSRERVRQVKVKIFSKLRKLLASEIEGEPVTATA